MSGLGALALGSLASGAGSIASTLLGGIFGGIGQNQTNETNLKIARETNAQNYKIWQEQMAHNIDLYKMQAQDNLDMYNLQRFNNIQDWRMQFDAENQYNTASAQRQRLEDAGLNPYLMMNGGSAGIANSNAPAPASMAQAHVNPSQAPTMQGYVYESPINSAVQMGLQSLSTVSQALNLNEQTQGMEQERIFNRDFRNPHLQRMFDVEYGKGVQERNLLQKQNHLAELEMNFLDDTYETRIEIAKQQNNLLSAQAIGQGLSNQSQWIINQFKPGHEMIDFLNKCEELVLKQKAGKISDQELRNLIKEELLKGAQIKTENAKQGLINAQTKTENDTRDEKEDLLRNQGIESLEKGIKLGHDNRLIEETIDETIDATNQKLKNDFNKAKRLEDEYRDGVIFGDEYEYMYDNRMRNPIDIKDFDGPAYNIGFPGQPGRENNTNKRNNKNNKKRVRGYRR